MSNLYIYIAQFTGRLDGDSEILLDFGFSDDEIDTLAKLKVLQAA